MRGCERGCEGEMQCGRERSRIHILPHTVQHSSIPQTVQHSTAHVVYLKQYNTVQYSSRNLK